MAERAKVVAILVIALLVVGACSSGSSGGGAYPPTSSSGLTITVVPTVTYPRADPGCPEGFPQALDSTGDAIEASMFRACSRGDGSTFLISNVSTQVLRLSADPGSSLGLVQIPTDGGLSYADLSVVPVNGQVLLPPRSAVTGHGRLTVTTDAAATATFVSTAALEKFVMKRITPHAQALKRQITECANGLLDLWRSATADAPLLSDVYTDALHAYGCRDLVKKVVDHGGSSEEDRLATELPDMAREVGGGVLDDTFQELGRLAVTLLERR